MTHICVNKIGHHWFTKPLSEPILAGNAYIGNGEGHDDDHDAAAAVTSPEYVSDCSLQPSTQSVFPNGMSLHRLFHSLYKLQWESVGQQFRHVYIIETSSNSWNVEDHLGGLWLNLFECELYVEYTIYLFSLIDQIISYWKFCLHARGCHMYDNRWLTTAKMILLRKTGLTKTVVNPVAALQYFHSWCWLTLLSTRWLFHELSNIISRKYKMPDVCPKHGFGHTYEVSAWNSHKMYDFCNTQISREYLGELAKR